MARRLAAALMSLILAAPMAAAAQDYGEHGGRRGGDWGDLGGFGGPRGGYDARGGGGRDGGGPDGWFGSHGFEGPGERRGGGPPDGYPRGRDGFPASRRGSIPRGPITRGQIPEGRGPEGRPLRRGQYLPPQARGEMIQDYERYHLRRPPRGYFWYRAGDDYVLAAVATGVIFEVIPSDDY
jgi:Ni/Co efflux regulator RcnB